MKDFNSVIVRLEAIFPVMKSRDTTAPMQVHAPMQYTCICFFRRWGEMDDQSSNSQTLTALFLELHIRPSSRGYGRKITSSRTGALPLFAFQKENMSHILFHTCTQSKPPCCKTILQRWPLSKPAFDAGNANHVKNNVDFDHTLGLVNQVDNQMCGLEHTYSCTSCA